MNQHNHQEARLKLFEDRKINEVWVYPKDGGKPFPQPAGKCTAEKDFQTPDLESFQEKIESRAGRAFQTTGAWSSLEYESIMDWVVLHLIRNTKSRKEFFASPDDYNNRFLEVFEKERLISHYYRFVDTYRCEKDRFLVTSDHPVVELWATLPGGEKEIVRCFAKSPEILILFSACNKPPDFPIPIEDYFSAMVWACADQFVYSHRNDVSIQRLRELVDTFEMSPVVEEVRFEVEFR